MLIRKIEAFMRQTKMPQTKFGRLAASDPRLVADLRLGRNVGRKLEQRVEHFMNTYREDSHAY
jgi:hypothetical protein